MYKNIFKISIFNGIVKMLFMPPLFLTVIHFKELNFTGTQIGIIFALSTFVTILTILPSGISSDKIKAKYLASFGLLLTSTQFFFLYQSQNFWLLLIFIILGGLGATIYSTAIDSLFYKSSGDTQVKLRIGIYNGIKFLSIGIGLGLAGYILHLNVSFKELFFYLSISFVILAVLAQFILNSNITSDFTVLHYKKDLIQKKVLFFLLIIFLFALHFGAESTSYSLFLKENLKLNNLQIGMYMGLAILPMALTVVIISKILGKLKVQTILLAGLFVSGTGHILMTINNPILSGIFRAYHEIGDAAVFFFLYYGTSKLFDISRIGGNSSMVALAAAIGNTVGALILGPIGAKYGYHLPIILSGLTTLVAFGTTLYFLEHFHHEHRPDRIKG